MAKGQEAKSGTLPENIETKEGLLEEGKGHWTYWSFGDDRLMKIYMAGPLFTAGERDQNKAIADGLVLAGHEVWLPQDRKPPEGEVWTATTLFRSCVDGVLWCDVVVACMDGPDPDSGTCFECGLAYGQKPIILYRTDIRDSNDGFGPYNLMMLVSADAVLDCKWLSHREVVEKLLDEIKRLA